MSRSQPAPRLTEVTQPLPHSASFPDVLKPLAQVAAQKGVEPLAKQLWALRQWLAEDLKDVEQAMDALVSPADSENRGKQARPGQKVRHAMHHLLGLPGKRIRPLCVLLAARLGTYPKAETLRNLAVACELVHAATLLHDDVIDDSSERRGAPTARVLFGNSASILAGDHLLIEALRRVQSTGWMDVLGSLLDVISRMVAAEALQLEQRGRFEPNREIYMEVIQGKTAALFSWGLKAGGQVAQLPSCALKALERVGLHLGMAFQLVDDILDLEGDPTITGKEVGVDIREGKWTWPLIVAAERDASLCRMLADIASAGPALGGPRAEELMALLRATGALQATSAYARFQADAARKELLTLPAGLTRSALEMVVASAVQRLR